MRTHIGQDKIGQTKDSDLRTNREPRQDWTNRGIADMRTNREPDKRTNREPDKIGQT